MKKLLTILGIAAATGAGLSSKAQTTYNIATRIGDFKRITGPVSDSLQFDIYMWAGTGYTSGTTFWTSANMRYDFTPVGVGVPATANGRISYKNDAYIATVTYAGVIGGAAAPVGTYRFGVTPSRGTLQDLPTTPVKMMTVSFPVVGAIGGIGDPNGNSTLVMRSAAPYSGNSSFWNTVTLGASNQAFEAGPVVVLPVELSNFDAVKDGARRSKITWVTNQEHGTSYFEVQRSADGKNFNASVARVTANGNSTNKLNYQTYDNSPLFGNNYYRLKSVDADGKFTYSETKKVVFGATAVVTAVPNPCVPATAIRINSDVAEAVDYNVTDATGKIVLSGKWNLTAGTTEHPLDLGNLASGLYLVNVSGDVVVAQLKVVKLQ